MKKLAILTRPLDRGISGSGMHLERITRAFLKLNKDFEVFFVHHSEKHHSIYDEGHNIITGRNPLTLAGKLNSLGIDVVHYNPLSVYSPIFGVKAKKCATIHGDAEYFLRGEYSFVKRTHARYLVPAYARKMDKIFTVSQATTRHVVERFGISPDKIYLTPNAVDDRFRTYCKEEMPDLRAKYTNGAKFLLSVCNFSARKNPWILLESFSILANSRPDLKFVIVGNGWTQSQQVTDYIKRNKLGDKVVLTGFVPTEEIPQLMNQAECFLFPSRYEGFGMPNLEAMACSCPVVTTKIFSIPEVVGNAALMMNVPGDAKELAALTVQILDDPCLRKRLVASGIENVRRYSWEASAGELMSGYLSLVS